MPAHLELSEGVRVVSQAEGVEGLSGVHLVQALSSGSAVDTVALNGSHEDDLHRAGITISACCFIPRRVRENPEAQRAHAQGCMHSSESPRDTLTAMDCREGSCMQHVKGRGGPKDATERHAAKGGGADLHKEGGDDGLGIDEAGDTQVLNALLVKDGCSCLPPGDVVCSVEQLWHYAACTHQAAYQLYLAPIFATSSFTQYRR